MVYEQFEVHPDETVDVYLANLQKHVVLFGGILDRVMACVFLNEEACVFLNEEAPVIILLDYCSFLSRATGLTLDNQQGGV